MGLFLTQKQLRVLTDSPSNGNENSNFEIKTKITTKKDNVDLHHATCPPDASQKPQRSAPASEGGQLEFQEPGGS